MNRMVEQIEMKYSKYFEFLVVVKNRKGVQEKYQQFKLMYL